jgi:hypothetical protein
MKTMSENQVALVNARQELKSTLGFAKVLRERIKDLTLVLKTEKAANKTLAAVARDAKLEAKRERVAAQIARLEARLAKMKTTA